MTFMVGILLVAANWGLRHSIYLSILSAAAFNFFFLPPILTFTVGDGRNWIALLAFLVTGIVASQLAERARREAKISRRRQREAERLYEFSQQMLVTGNVIDLLNVLPQMIAATFNLAGAAVYLRERDRVYRSSPNYMDVTAAELRDAAFTRDHRRDEERDVTLIPILLGTRPIGAVGITGDGTSPEALDAVCGLAAIAIERAGAVETLTRVEASRESERLRNALLDSVAHELRTPLTSITAAITSLRSDPLLDKEQSAEMMQVIEEEAARLDRLVGQAMEMAELDANDIKLDLRLHSMREAVDLALEAVQGPLKTHPVELRLPDTLPLVQMDLERIAKVLQHLLENAAKYSAEGSPIFVSAEVAKGQLVTSVADRGAGVDDFERMMIFDKFYRGQGQRYRVQGTGMGLAIAKAIVEAHGGSIDVTSQPSQGSVFSFYLPLQHVRPIALELRQVGDVPSAAERLDQKNAGIHLAAHDVDIVALVVQRGRLRGHDLQVRVEAADVSVVEDLLCRLCRQRGLMLVFGLLLENTQRNQVVFHLLKRGQRRLPVVGDGLIVAGVGLLGDRRSAACVEDRLRQRRADRPQQTGRVEQVCEGRCFDPDRSVQRDCRIERGACDADAVVRLGDAPLGGGDVGTALQKFGGQARRNDRRTRIERSVGERERRRRFAEKNGDGVFELRALQGDVARLHFGCLELRLRLVYVGLRSDPAFKAIVRDAVGLFVVLHGIVQQLLLGVRAAGFEVVDGEFGLQAQQDCLAVACACLRLFSRGAYGSANAAPDVDLVVEIDGKLDVADTVALRAVRVEVGAVRRTRAAHRRRARLRRSDTARRG